MTRKQMHDLVHAWIEALNRHDPQGVADAYLEEAVSRDMGRDMALLGREAIVESLATYVAAFPDIRWTISRLGIDTETLTVYMEWHAFGTHLGPYHGVPATGRQIEVDGCHRVHDVARGPHPRATRATGTSRACCARSGVMPAWSAEGAVAQ